MKQSRFIGMGALFLVLISLVMGSVVTHAQDATSEPSFIGDPAYPAPEFPAGLDWLNVSAPVTIQQLRGKVVLLDFWTYGCINCIHMIPVIKHLENTYGDALAVIGVHSAKFANEGKTSNIRQIVERYGLTHPVINDHDFATWNTYASYGVNAWPTFVLIDPRGNMYAVQAGEIPQEAFDQVIGGMIAQFDQLGEIKRDPLPIRLEKDAQPPSALAFPGKVAIDADGGRLFIADSSHNRIIVSDLNTYTIRAVVGNGDAAFKDGDYKTASFNKPQGMAYRDGTLYVADTDNHAIRAIDLNKEIVSTVAGTGVQDYERATGAPLTTKLSSPWDVTFDDAGNLYIAMAGAHQIWMMTADRSSVGPLVGSGREGLQDDVFKDAELAQPSGLFWRGNILYFADAESSSVREANLNTKRVRTLIGPTRNDLFAFGDVDGAQGEAKLQHTLAVTGAETGKLFVADTYNSKIKLMSPGGQTISTLFGLGGTGGFRDGGATEAQFDEPGGLAYHAGKLYVADTNNDAIRVVDVAAGTVSTVVFPNAEVLQMANAVTVVGGNASAGERVTAAAQTVKAGNGTISLNVVLPEGYKLNTIAPFSAVWASDAAPVSIAEADRSMSAIAPPLPIRVPVTLAEGQATVTGDLTIYYCEAVKESLCFIDQVTVVIPVTVGAGGAGTELVAERVITPPHVTTDGIGG